MPPGSIAHTQAAPTLLLLLALFRVAAADSSSAPPPFCATCAGDTGQYTPVPWQLSLFCSAPGDVIASIGAISWGDDASGVCGAPVNASDPCDNGGNATRVRAAIERACLGRPWCPLFVNESSFGSPCRAGSASTHRLTVQASCASGAGNWSCSTSDPGLWFAGTLGDGAVLQRAPAGAALYGAVSPGAFPRGGGATVTVTLASATATTASAAPLATVSSPVAEDGSWKVVLPPMEPAGGGNYSATATCVGCFALPFMGPRTISDLVFGDVWMCSGQSNVQLAMQYTFGLNDSTAALKAGKYANVRYYQQEFAPTYAAPLWVQPVYTPDAFNYKWSHAGDLVNNEGGDWLPGIYATCWYFAQSLADIMAAAGEVVPLGIIGSAQGGTMIEQWCPYEAQLACGDIQCLCTTPHCNGSQPLPGGNCSGNGGLFNSNVAPHANYTIKGWIWHQGENNVGGVAGNVLFNTGYACLLRQMVASWRALFSATPGTTDPLAPFGIATLPYWEAEGSPQNIGVHYMAHLGSYGVLPNPALPNTFMSSGYDIGDPWESQHCSSWKCCIPPWEDLGPQCWEDHRGEWDNRTPFFMGGIHARTKLEMGWRFAHGAYYGAGYGHTEAPAIGPVISGCTLAADRSTLTLAFNSSLLRNQPLVIYPNFAKQPAADGNFTTETSLTYVLVNVSLPDAVDQGLRMNKAGPGPYGYWPWEGGNAFFPGDWPSNGSSSSGGHLPGPGWVAVQLAAGARPNEVVIDLTSYPQLAGLPITAVRHGLEYMMSCGSVQGTWPGGPSRPCAPKTHPLGVLAPSGGRVEPLPAVGFVARIDQASGKCVCLPPQACDA